MFLALFGLRNPTFWKANLYIFSGVIRNSVMNADFAVHCQFVQLETNISLKIQKMIQKKLKAKNQEQFWQRLDL